MKDLNKQKNELFHFKVFKRFKDFFSLPSCTVMINSSIHIPSFSHLSKHNYQDDVKYLDCHPLPLSHSHLPQKTTN